MPLSPVSRKDMIDLKVKDIASDLHLVITGGESGPNARASHPDWFRSLRDQCSAAGVAFFHKQNGSHSMVYDRDVDDPDWRRCCEVEPQTPKGRWLNLAGGHGFHGKRVVRINPVSKKAAGRLFDGREWNEFPEVYR
jgi:protein gp37